MTDMFLKLQQTLKEDERGQATTEVVLLLVVSVMLVLLLANQIFKPFNSWMDNYMGAYLQCLLDAGELPSLGYQDDNALCNSRFEPFTAVAGRPAKEGSKSASEGKTPPPKPSNDSSLGSGGSGSSSSSSRRLTLINNGSRGSDSAAMAGAEKQQVVGQLEKSQFMKVTRVGSSSDQKRSQRTLSNGIQGLLDYEREKIEKRNNRKRNVAEVDTDGSRGAAAKKFRVKPPERKTASMTEEEPWSFGDYIKYALILMVLIALVLFIAGQFLQITKGSEK